jgi:CheY-like chemotaxis protein
MSTVSSLDSGASDQAGDASSGGSAKSQPRILCVDDEPVMLSLLQRTLGARFEVVTQQDPGAALELLKGGGFAVVICDMKMPRMAGTTFLERVKAVAPACTRLALTGCLDWQLPDDLAFGILTKPCPLPLLEATVVAAVQFHALAVGEPPRAEPSEAPASPPVPSPARAGHHTLGAAPVPVAVQSGLRPRELEAAVDERAPGGAAHSIPAARSLRLAVALLGTRVELWPRATLLGRAKDCDIVVEDPRVAARHVRFFSSWRGVTVQDVSGTRSVQVNGAPLVGVRFVQPGDRIDLGPFEIRVEVAESSEESEKLDKAERC